MATRAPPCAAHPSHAPPISGFRGPRKKGRAPAGRLGENVPMSDATPGRVTEGLGDLVDLGDLSLPDLGDLDLPDLGDLSLPDLGDLSLPDLA